MKQRECIPPKILIEELSDAKAEKSGLMVSIRTERLELVSLRDKDQSLNLYIPLFADEVAMEKFGKGAYDLYLHDKDGSETQRKINKESNDYKLLDTVI